MSERKLSDVAAEAVVWSLIADVAKERKDAARAELTARMGADAVAVKAIANSTDIGRASWIEGSERAVVVNRDQFETFVHQHYPDELLTTVNPAFQKQFLSKLKNIEGYAITGDGEPVPGVKFHQPEPYVSVRKSAEARATVEALLDKGRLNLDGITQPQLEGQS